MINEERFWESAIAESVREGSPPDVSARVLAELASEPATPPTKRRGKLVVLRISAEWLTAAAALFLIAWLTGLLRLPWDGEGSGPDDTPQQIAAAPGTEFTEIDGKIELKHGWLLVTTGAPDVLCDGSILNKVDGQVLVHAGSMPTGEQAEAVVDWLQANKLERNMITEMKNWSRGAGMAVLVLAGSAMLDGNRIEAKEDRPGTDSTVHFVQSVMDIENLPEGVTEVWAGSLDGAHLEFLCERTTIRNLDFSDCYNLRTEYLVHLQKLKAIEYLNLSGAHWIEQPDYASLTKLENLKSVTIDFCANTTTEDADSKSIQNSLRILSDRGVKLTLTGLVSATGIELSWIGSNLTSVTSLDVGGNTTIDDADLRTLPQMAKLSYLDLSGCLEIGELGLAYVSKVASLRELRTTVDLSSAETYQLAHMDQLEALSIRMPFKPGRTTEILKPLGRLPNLVRLTVEGFADREAAAAIREFKNIDRLELTWKTPMNRDRYALLEVYGAAGVRSVEFWPTRRDMDDIKSEGIESTKEALDTIEKTDRAIEIRLLMDASDFDPAVKQPLLLDILGKFTALKIVRINYYVSDPDTSEAFIAYMKSVLGQYELEFERERDD